MSGKTTSTNIWPSHSYFIRNCKGTFFPICQNQNLLPFLFLTNIACYISLCYLLVCDVKWLSLSSEVTIHQNINLLHLKTTESFRVRYLILHEIMHAIKVLSWYSIATTDQADRRDSQTIKQWTKSTNRKQP